MIEHKTVSLADQVYEHLESDILSGKYKRGDLLTELKLCAELGVSRTPVREALRRLEQERLIEETGKGVKVLGITGKDLEDIFTIRTHLEGIAAAQTAKRITDAQLAELHEVLELQEFYLNKQDAEHMRAYDSEFHKLVCRFSGSPVFYNTLIPLHKKTQKYRKASVQHVSRAAESVSEHTGIYEAIAARDAALATARMVQHAQNAYEHIKLNFETDD